MDKKIAALDIGGTSIKSGIWTCGQVQQVQEQDTNAKNGGCYVMERAKEILHQYHGFDAIGISTAGQVDSEKGCIRYANENIPGYTGMQVRQILEREFSVPVAVENDVNAAATGEARFGAGKDQKDFLCITYGTGVGGAVVMDGAVYTGSAFSAGEFGGIVVHPEDRKAGQPFSGCYEKYASTTALVRMAREYDSSLDTGRKIFARIEEAGVQAVVDRWIEEIVLGLVTVIHIFNPSCIVLGGGVMAQPYIIKRLRQRTEQEIMDSFRNVQLRPAELGNLAGILGAVHLASKRLID
ncbi:ROK family protein [Clostridium sp. AN503]|uniref:ROK family protein n=1 Tax=Clostridium sp. AN503 TaxID=3160598 RepID=UPI00345750D7